MAGPKNYKLVTSSRLVAPSSRLVANAVLKLCIMHNGSTAVSFFQAMCCLGVVLFPNRVVWSGNI